MTSLDRLLELGHADLRLVPPGCEQRRLVDEVGEVCARESGGLACESADVDVVVVWLALGMHLEDLLPTLDVGAIDNDLTVEPARAEQRRVEDVRSVGRSNDDHSGFDVETVQFDEQLVERLLTFVMPAAETGATMATDRIDLVDEHDRWCAGLCLVKEVANPACSDANEHLYELGS